VVTLYVRAAAPKRSYLSTCNFVGSLLSPMKGGRMIQADTLRKVMRTHLDGLGLMNLHFYGCTALEIMTITGHQVEQMVKLYTNKSEQKKLATSRRQKA